MSKLTDRHDRIRAEAAQKLFELHLRLIADDKAHQTARPEDVKAFDDVLDEHVFRKLFT